MDLYRQGHDGADQWNNRGHGGPLREDDMPRAKIKVS
jgi:hypothetical protein